MYNYIFNRAGRAEGAADARAQVARTPLFPYELNLFPYELNLYPYELNLFPYELNLFPYEKGERKGQLMHVHKSLGLLTGMLLAPRLIAKVQPLILSHTMY